MPTPHVLILRAPGTNCDQETAYAFQLAGAKTEVMHVNRMVESPSQFDRFQILCIPGGFSFGDDVGAGQILALQMRHHLADFLARFKADGKLILGICNGFQVIIRSGILAWTTSRRTVPRPRWPAMNRLVMKIAGYAWACMATSAPCCAASRRCICRSHTAKENLSRATRPFCNRLESAGQLVMRYRPLKNGNSTTSPLPFPDNPNGSQLDVAGICDTTGRVLGIMPHPERHLDPTNHPRWTRGEAGEVGDGLKVFVNAVEFFRMTSRLY